MNNPISVAPLRLSRAFHVASTLHLKNKVNILFPRPDFVLTLLTMARRRKNRTHKKAPADEQGSDGNPKSFVLKHGQVGHSLAQLVRDLRKVMEPHTASRLKVSIHVLATQTLWPTYK